MFSKSESLLLFKYADSGTLQQEYLSLERQAEIYYEKTTYKGYLPF